jgi:hypothetical protein
LRLRYGQGCRPAVEPELALPVVELPLMPELELPDPLAPELGLLLELILLADASPLALMPEPEPEPEAAVFSFGCPVALSRQWVAGETEEEPELVLGELGD